MPVLFLLLGGWALTALALRLRRARRGGRWWLAYGLAVTAGFCGAWFAADVDYPVSEKFRFAGFPIPVAVWHLENSQWVDFVPSTATAHLTLAANGTLLGLCAAAPVCLLGDFRGRRGSTPRP